MALCINCFSPVLPCTTALLQGMTSQQQHNRKMLQWYGRYGRGNRYNNGDAQLARNSAAIVNTQYAIRSAVQEGASLPATTTATRYGNDQAYLASQRWWPYGYSGWYGRH